MKSHLRKIEILGPKSPAVYTLIKIQKSTQMTMFDLTYHPTFYTPIDRSRRVLQLCRGSRGELVESHLRFRWDHQMNPTPAAVGVVKSTLTQTGAVAMRRLHLNPKPSWQRSTGILNQTSPSDQGLHCKVVIGTELYKFAVEVEV